MKFSCWRTSPEQILYLTCSMYGIRIIRYLHSAGVAGTHTQWKGLVISQRLTWSTYDMFTWWEEANMKTYNNIANHSILDLCQVVPSTKSMGLTVVKQVKITKKSFILWCVIGVTSPSRPSKRQVLGRGNSGIHLWILVKAPTFIFCFRGFLRILPWWISMFHHHLGIFSIFSNHLH